MSTIINILAMIGTVTLLLLVHCIYRDEIKSKIKSWWKRTNKIRCLCKHEYVETFYWYNPLYTQYELKCILCGEKKIIKIFKEDNSDDKS